MVEREIICCGPSGWTKAIAWIQIIAHSFATIVLLMYLFAFITTAGFNSKDMVTLDEFSYSSTPVISLTCPQFYGVLLLIILLSVIGLAMGVVLLQGSKQRNVKYLNAWIHFAGFLMICNLISIILRDSPMDEILFRLLFTAALYGFGIMVVRMHAHDIQREDEYNTEQPPEYSKIMLEKV